MDLLLRSKYSLFLTKMCKSVEKIVFICIILFAIN